MKEIKEKLDKLRAYYNRVEFIDTDPVQFPHRYTRLQDVEIVSFLVATISWGRRPLILQSAEKMLALMGDSPYDFVMNEGYMDLGEANIHRTFFEHDLFYYCKGLHALYSDYSSLEAIFVQSSSLWEGINLFRAHILAANGGVDTKHISNPAKNSACKRLFMALRGWFVRMELLTWEFGNGYLLLNCIFL